MFWIHNQHSPATCGNMWQHGPLKQGHQGMIPVGIRPSFAPGQRRGPIEDSAEGPRETTDAQIHREAGRFSSSQSVTITGWLIG